MLLFSCLKTGKNQRERGEKAMRIYDWRKFLTFIAVLLLFIVLVASIFILQEEEREPQAIETYTVQSGETLWSISTQYRPDDMSIQEYIYNVQNYNKISSMIYAGQTIQLLIY